MRKFLIVAFLALSNILQGAPAGAPFDYQVKDFSERLKDLPGFSPQLIDMHLKLYQGYVANTNKLLLSISDMAKRGEDTTIAYGALKRRMGWEMDGMLLHEAYFENMGGRGSLDSNAALYRQIVNDFGSYSAWEQDFKATGLIRGIGWVILYQDPKEGRLHNVWINEHATNHIAGGTPILVMDVWEHAYITEYGLNRSGYINAFFNVIDWNVVKNRFATPSPKR
ncbi:MAG: superoxide dismutase [Chlamydiales bacterium]|nr:superoxide dismutase [Chlamydiales bacterium]